MKADDVSAILGSVFPRWITDLGLRPIDVGPDTLRLLLPASDAIVRVGGFVAGQVSLAVADTAMVLAIATKVGEFRPVSTVALSSTFMRPLANAGIVCEARVIRLGRTLAFCRASLANEQPGDVAVDVTATYAMPLGG